MSTFSNIAAAADPLILASGPPGSKALSVGVGLSSLTGADLLPASDIDLQTIESAGAVDNVRRLQANDVQLAILPSTVGHAARIGSGSFAGSPPETRFRAIATLWRDALHVIMRADDVSTGTIDDLRRLKSGRMLIGDASSGMADANRLLIADLGLEPALAVSPEATAESDSISAIRQGKVDILSRAVRPPEDDFAGLFEASSSSLRLLDVTQEQMIEANGNHWLWTPYVIPAATYAGQAEDIWTIALSNLLVVRADIDDDLVYAITKSIFANLSHLHRAESVLDELDTDTALAGMTIPLHPGALRYYREAGLISLPTAGPTVPTHNLERYPDGDVAGDWLKGKGGPFLKAPLPVQERHLPDARPLKEPAWRKRATL